MRVYSAATPSSATLVFEQGGITTTSCAWKMTLGTTATQSLTRYGQVTDAQGCTSAVSVVYSGTVAWWDLAASTFAAAPTSCVTGLGTLRLSAGFDGWGVANAYDFTLTRNGVYLRSGVLSEIWVSLPGVDQYEFTGLLQGDYSLVVSARNHLPPAYASYSCPASRTYTATVGSPDCATRLTLRAALGGALPSGTLMTDGLRSQGLLPSTEPYSAAGLTYVGTAAGRTVVPGLLASVGTNSAVDWVVVELRDTAAPEQVVCSRAAMLRRNGDVVDMDGNTAIGFPAPAGPYYIALRHRNHLGVMTAQPRYLNMSPIFNTLDFRSATTAVHGTDARKDVGGVLCLWPGDVNGDGWLRYTGAENDRDPVLVSVGGSLITATLGPVYRREDVNLDGTVKYTGMNNDRDPILIGVGGALPTATRQQQLP